MKSRAAIRQEIQQEDLDLSPSDVERMVQRMVRLRQVAHLGGQARAKSLSPARRRAIAKRAAGARWGGK